MGAEDLKIEESAQGVGNLSTMIPTEGLWVGRFDPRKKRDLHLGKGLELKVTLLS